MDEARRRTHLIRSRLGDATMSLVTWEFHTIYGRHLARISIDPSNHPIQDHKDGQDTLWLRTPTATIAITDRKDRDQVIARRWSTTAPL